MRWMPSIKIGVQRQFLMYFVLLFVIFDTEIVFDSTRSVIIVGFFLAIVLSDLAKLHILTVSMARMIFDLYQLAIVSVFFESLTLTAMNLSLQFLNNSFQTLVFVPVLF